VLFYFRKVIKYFDAFIGESVSKSINLRTYCINNELMSRKGTCLCDFSNIFVNKSTSNLQYHEKQILFIGLGHPALSGFCTGTGKDIERRL
jgi:hypothetical protein